MWLLFLCKRGLHKGSRKLWITRDLCVLFWWVLGFMLVFWHVLKPTCFKPSDVCHWCEGVVNSLDGQFSPPFAPPTSPPTFPSPPPPSTPNICFLVLACLAHLFFLTLHPHTAQSTSSWLYTFFFSFISSLCSAWYFCHNSLTFSALFPAHFSLWARHPLQVAFPPRNISNPLCPLHFQHCFFSTSSTTISPHAIPCFVVFKCFPQLLFLIWQSHTSQ